MLVDEVGVEPGPELQRLHEAILRHDASLELELEAHELPRELDAAAAPALVGRERELAWLRERWERARGGVGGLIVLVGEPGIGKTRLAAELAGEVHRVGAVVLYAAGGESSEAVVACDTPGAAGDASDVARGGRRRRERWRARRAH